MTFTIHQESRLNSGIYQSDQDAVSGKDISLPLGPRNLLRLAKRCRARRANLRSSYGSIGGGESTLFVVTDDGQTYGLDDTRIQDTRDAMAVIEEIMDTARKVATVPD